MINPKEVTYKVFDDEIWAILSEINLYGLYGTGKTENDALKDLDLELLDLSDVLKPLSDNKLGKVPKKWKKKLIEIGYL